MQQREVVNKFDRVQPPGTLFTITLLCTDNTEQQTLCWGFLSATQTQRLSFHFGDEDHRLCLNNLPVWGFQQLGTDNVTESKTSTST